MKNLITHKIDDSNISIAKKDGIILEKGIVLTEDYLKTIEDKLKDITDIFISYPDIFLDIITPEEDDISLFFYQRIILRALMRFKEIYWVACRATSKTFLSILALFLQCIFMPGTKRFIVATYKVQAAKVAKEKIIEIYQHWPLLKREVVGGDISDTPGNFGKDYVTILFRNGSQLDVVGGDGTRGLRRNGGLLDELRDADEVEITEIVLPLMNVARRLPDNTVNPREVNAQQIVMTSAGVKSHFSYDKLIDMFENSIINPNDSFVMGTDYRVPILYGLLDKNFVNKIKSSPSFNEESFGREYLSIFTGGSEESWFNYDKISKYRKIKNPERHAINRRDSKEFYLLSIDVGRLHDQTVVTVFKVNIIKDRFYCSIVNIIVLGKTAQSKQFSVQAADIKKIIRNFNPREVVIDINGLGIGLGEEMTKIQYDENGNILPAYGFINDDNFKKTQPKDAICILYGIKANGPLKSNINSNAYTRISNGMCRFLIKEQEAKSALLSTKVGQKMTLEQRVIRLMPHEMTTKLFDEMANLRLRRSGSALDIVVEQINSRVPDDKYYSFAYGLWRIKELEEEYNKRARRKTSIGNRKLVFFSGAN